MKIRIYSDMHLEFSHHTTKLLDAEEVAFRKEHGHGWHDIPPTEGDEDKVLVLAGDIDKGKRIAQMLDELAPRFKAVIFVAGNHEMYGENIDTIYPKMTPNRPNAHMLQNNKVTYDGVEFLGTTLWTDFNKGDPFTVWDAKRYMNDYRYIRQNSDYRKLHPERILLEHHRAADFLRKTIDPDKKQVVVTHHAPTFAAQDGDPHEGSSGQYYFYCTDMDDIIPDAGTWIYGHTHHRSDVMCGDTRVISACRGYPGERVEGHDIREIEV